MATQAGSRRASDFSPVGNAPLWDGIAYWATIIGVYLMVGGLMFYSRKDKLSLLPPNRSDNWLRFGTPPPADD